MSYITRKEGTKEFNKKVKSAYSNLTQDKIEEIRLMMIEGKLNLKKRHLRKYQRLEKRFKRIHNPNCCF